jgi:hypothetical protein
MIRPKSSTWMSSQQLITRLMSCSTITTARRCAARSRSSAPNRRVSAGVRPDEGSSSSSSRGPVASARATSRSRATAVGTWSARWSAKSRMPTRRSRWSARRTRSSAPPRRMARSWISMATSTFSRTVSEPKASSRWNVRPMPPRLRALGLMPAMFRPR